jgi:predicted regulator of Ras-like GTPase activity (Roadblock/LC7/MglB family)
MTDYFPVLARAVAATPAADSVARQAIYRSARRAMVRALVSARPNALNAILNTEHGEFDTAVARVEAQVRRGAALREPPKDLAREMGGRDAAGEGPDPEDESQPEINAGTSAVSTRPDVDRSRSVEERPMSRLDELNKILRKLQSDSPGLEASALISEDGLMIASALTPDLDETRVAGMTATLLNLGTRAAVELARGEVKEVIIRGERGYAVMIDAGRGVLLLALANESAKLGLIFFDMHEAIRGLKKVL